MEAVYVPRGHSGGRRPWLNNCVYGMISDHGGLMSGESSPRGCTLRDSRVKLKSLTGLPEYDSFEIYTYQSNPL
jgi:hypothetical protein